jgi:hypothetical protein
MLEVETRNMRGPRLFDSSGIPLHGDNETIIEERIYLDKSDPNVLRNEITTFDHALMRPWTVSRFYRRGLNPVYEEYPCTEDNHWIAVGGELYLSDSEGFLMPIQKNQPPPLLSRNKTRRRVRSRLPPQPANLVSAAYLRLV